MYDTTVFAVGDSVIVPAERMVGMGYRPLGLDDHPYTVMAVEEIPGNVCACGESLSLPFFDHTGPLCGQTARQAVRHSQVIFVGREGLQIGEASGWWFERYAEPQPA